MNSKMDISTALCKALEGEPLSVDDALSLNSYSTDELCEAADAIRLKHSGNQIHTCSIVNARSGRCSEDCKWCSQSIHHSTGVDEYEYLPLKDLTAAYEHTRDRGVNRFSLVTSGRRIPPTHTAKFCSQIRTVARNPEVNICASMGLLDEAQLRQLKDAGVSRYHCNLETAPSHFPTLCTTHTQADKLATIAAARRVGMEVCVGGIIGMGESLRQRLELAEASRLSGAVAFPLNILTPIPGTPLESTPLIGEEEIIRSVALMRFVMPKVTIHFAGGRGRLSTESVEKMLRGGANGLMVGNFLTTSGCNSDQDFELINRAGYFK